jgi:hypothetical protein
VEYQQIVAATERQFQDEERDIEARQAEMDTAQALLDRRRWALKKKRSGFERMVAGWQTLDVEVVSGQPSRSDAATDDRGPGRRVRGRMCAARLSVEKLAEALVAGQPLPERAEHTALLRWLAQSTAKANPGLSEGELAVRGHDRRTEGDGVTPVKSWSAEEREKRALLEQGIAVAVNMRRHGALVAWAKERGLFVRVDRATHWGNPVRAREGRPRAPSPRYRDGHLLVRADLLARLGELRGKALGCWCAPGPCHADVLTAAAAEAN